MILITKKGVVFSILAFFISLLIFAFGSYYIFSGDYTKDLDFKESRINFLNNEIEYFSKVYVLNSVTFATHSSMLYLVQNETLIRQMNNNYSQMNLLLQEMIINGSVNGVENSVINESCVNYLVSLFSDDFYNNYKGNFSYKINAINVYEEDPYYVSVQVLGEYHVTTFDNISSWDFNESFKIAIPIYEFRDPEFARWTEENISIRYVDLYNSNINWTLENFNESLVSNYSSLYLEPEHKYLVGTSFLNRLLNVSTSSYKNVTLFYSFDYDEEELEVYDTSLYTEASFFGNSKALYNFDNQSVNGSVVLDLSNYNNSIYTFGDVNCSVSGVNSEGCSFDGNGDFMNFNISSYVFENNFSISFWFKTNFSDVGKYRLIRHNDAVGFDLYLTQNSLELIENEDDLTKLNTTIQTDDSWNNVVIVFSDSNKYLYLNGVLIESNARVMTKPTKEYMTIGSYNGVSEFFNGSIDEFAVYSKVLTEDDISNLYKERNVLYLDYMDSLYGRGVMFDGQDDYMNISFENFVNLSEYTIEIWIKPSSLPTDLNSRQGILNLSNTTHSARLFLNENGNLEYDVLPGEIGNLESTINSEEWFYFTLVYDGTAGNLYKNAVLQDSFTTSEMSLLNVDNVKLGFNLSTKNTYFNGVVDEVKIYTIALSQEDINQNYYNFASKGKGCCNYITLINPTSMGFNTVEHNFNVSYNSKLFFDYYNNSIDYNLTLWNLSNISSTDISKDYYNFMFDDCMMQAYSVYTFDYYTELVHEGQYNDSCSNYVREGVY